MKIKKVLLISVMLLAVMLSMPTRVEAISIGDSTILFGNLGDINSDKKIDNNDLNLLKNYLQNKTKLTLFQRMRADVNIDFRINTNDQKALETYIKQFPTEVKVTNITITGNKTLKVAETIKLTATITPNNATNKTIEWDSSNPFVATVVQGYVLGLAPGNVEIKAICGDKQATYKITIEKNKILNNIKESISESTNNLGEYFKNIKVFDTGLFSDAADRNQEPATSSTPVVNEYLYTKNGKEFKTAITKTKIDQILETIKVKDIRQYKNSSLSEACLKIALYYRDIILNRISSPSLTNLRNYVQPDKSTATITTTKNSSQTKQYIDNKVLPILKVKTSGSHYMLVIGYTGEGTNFNDYLLLDPYYGRLDIGNSGIANNVYNGEWQVRQYP